MKTPVNIRITKWFTKNAKFENGPIMGIYKDLPRIPKPTRIPKPSGVKVWFASEIKRFARQGVKVGIIENKDGCIALARL
jgi:hypothetical protein